MAATTVITPVELGAYRVRELPEAEWDRLQDGPGPLRDVPLQPSPNARVLVIEDRETGAIVGYWPMFAMMHVDHLYLDPVVRQHPKLGLVLMGALAHALRADQVGIICAVIADADQPENGQLAESLGLARVPGQLYIGAVPPAAADRRPSEEAD